MFVWLPRPPPHTNSEKDRKKDFSSMRIFIKFLKQELARCHAQIQLRIIDAQGKQRMTFDRRVPIGIKQHLHPKAADGFTPPEISFTIQRVGLEHLWTRL